MLSSLLLLFFLLGATKFSCRCPVSLKLGSFPHLGVIGWWCPEVQEIECLTQTFGTSGAASSWLCFHPVCSFAWRLGRHWLTSHSGFQSRDFVLTACSLPLRYFGKVLNRLFPTFPCLTDLCGAAPYAFPFCLDRALQSYSQLTITVRLVENLTGHICVVKPWDVSSVQRVVC